MTNIKKHQKTYVLVLDIRLSNDTMLLTNGGRLMEYDIFSKEAMDEIVGTDEHFIDEKEARELGIRVEQFPVEFSNDHEWED